MVEVYHVSDCGKNNKNLAKILKKIGSDGGLYPRSGTMLGSVGSTGQKNGVFFAKEFDSHLGGLYEGAKEEGFVAKPLMLIADCDLGASWELDYEEHSSDIMTQLFSNYRQTLANMKPDSLRLPGDLSMIAAQAVEQPIAGLKIRIKHLHSHKTYTILQPWDMDEMDRIYRMTDAKAVVTELEKTAGAQLPNIGGWLLEKNLTLDEYAFMQSLRDYLVSTKGGEYLADEKAIKERIFRQDNYCDVKYTNPIQPLKIKDVRVLENNQWKSVLPRKAQEVG